MAALSVLVACATPSAPSPDVTADAVAPSGSFGDASLIDPLDDTDASIGARAARLVSTRCVGGPETHCHGEGAGGTHLDLDPKRGDVVGVPARGRPELLRAQPGAPERSYLWLKVNGDGGLEGGAMPPTLGSRDPRLEALFRRWILDGCPAP